MLLEDLSIKTRAQFSEGKYIVKPRGNLECGSAQPSLFLHFYIEKVLGNILILTHVSLKVLNVLILLKFVIYSNNIVEQNNRLEMT